MRYTSCTDVAKMQTCWFLNLQQGPVCPCSEHKNFLIFHLSWFFFTHWFAGFFLLYCCNRWCSSDSKSTQEQTHYPFFSVFLLGGICLVFSPFSFLQRVEHPNYSRAKGVTLQKQPTIHCIVKLYIFGQRWLFFLLSGVNQRRRKGWHTLYVSSRSSS